jgi:hypothetical protein
MDPCYEGSSWFEKVFGKRGAMDLTDPEKVPAWFDKYIPAVIFDLQWPAWLLRQLIEKMIDQMDINYDRYSAECKRLYAVHNVFSREAAKATRQNALTLVDQRTRVTACITLTQTMIVTYQKL